jgi:hypothetical protein
MVDPILYLVIAATTLFLIAGTIFLSYWIPKRLGYKKIGIALSGSITFGMLFLIFVQFVLNDYLFFKSDAKEFLLNHGISLKEEFKIIYNDADELLDAYQRFDIEISLADKLRIIDAIRSSDNFGDEKFTSDQGNNSITSNNYEDSHAFIRKSRKTFGPGEISIVEVIEVSKEQNTVTCHKYIP